jgi:hypothetical protein
MLQLSIDLVSLNKAQREAVSEFILGFPNNQEEVFTMEPVTITPDDEEPTAEEAFAVGELPMPVTTLDRNGLPWDERIHASSRAKTADGSWRAKRNVDPALVAKVEGELKALMALPAAPPAPVGYIESGPTPTMVDVIFTPPPPPVAVARIETTVFPPPPPPPPAPVIGNTWVAFISEVSGKISEGKLTQDELKQACEQNGISNFSMLGNRLDLIPQVQATISAFALSR